MWYIVKTDFYKEQGAIDDLLRLDGIGEIYFPVVRQELKEIGMEDSKPIRFRPAINGILFVYACDRNKLKAHLTTRGYFLKPDETDRTIAGRHRQVYGNAHLFTYSTEPQSLDSILEKSSIPDEDIYRYKVCIEQRAANVEDVRIVGESYNHLVSENDTVMIVDGPFAGFTGVIRQLKSHGVKDRHLFFRLGNMCVSLSGIRRFSYIVVRESGKGKKAQIPNTWRYIDFLTGRLQAAGFVDTAPAVLRNILYHYNKVSSIDECQTLLLQVAKARKSVSVKPNEHSGTCIKSAMAGKRVMESDEADSMEIARQAVYIEQMSDAERGALESLKRFFNSADNSVARALEDLVPYMPLRPFLTPTSGVHVPEGGNFVLLQHSDFTELILRVNLKHVFVKPNGHGETCLNSAMTGKRGMKSKTGRPESSDRNCVYYAHISLKPDTDGSGIEAMVNWGGFIHRYVGLTEEERAGFLEDLADKGYNETVRLLTHGNITHISPCLCGFATAVHGFTLDDVVARYDKLPASGYRLPVSLLRSLYPVCRLVRDCIPAAIELWQRQRFLEWRHLVQRFVFLHNVEGGR